VLVQVPHVDYVISLCETWRLVATSGTNKTSLTLESIIDVQAS